jgi:hypothetical protein
VRQGGGEPQGRQERREDGELRREPEGHQGPWRPEREAVSQEDAGRLGHQEDGERQGLPEHQEDEGPQERLGEAGHPHRRDAERQVLLGPEGHQRYQLLHTPSHGRRAAAAG